MGDRAGGRRLAIFGAGHVHVELIRRLGPIARAGAEVTIVEPEDFWYSGLATGVLGGRYEVELDRVDVARLARRAGAWLIRDRVEEIDPAARVARLAGGGTLGYDLAALDLGSTVPADRVPGLAEHAFAVKPIRRLAELRADLARRFRARPLGDGDAHARDPDGGDGPLRVLVIGGGATACELAGNVRALAERHRAPIAVTLASSGARLLPGFPEGAARAVSEALGRWAGITVRTGSTVDRVGPGEAVLAGGDRLPFDVAIAANGLTAHPLVARLGLPTSEGGRLLIDPHLRSVAEPTLFAGGDCATLAGVDLPRIGVVAIRQAPVLAHNLLASLRGRPLRRYRPRRHHLLILNLGDGTGLACFGPLWHRGRAMLWLKEVLDCSFLRRLG
ncbi:NAD(P)/FAD-dependent oxidoreductase [Tautonia plasticadhaerens]|uniref:NADH dehydrogenase n=1 Tax=Tautonia plasticadhaerens TaxID=2527974 RepID=A0A518H1S2_9BACT|nr:FAD-dependent oxidoreductase [Tautonia plasticadhaerens]QDV34787.1 NADH dehydrogenase [Tautonia plasticadhaerens]